MSGVADILAAHNAAMQKINDDGRAHVERVCQAQAKMIERYLPEAEKVAGDLTPPEPKNDSSDVLV